MSPDDRGQGAQQPGQRRVRVLLVDDLHEIRVLVRAALRLHGGFEVVGEADRGDRAVALARELAPDVVVLDLGLPDASGREVLLRLQEHAPDAKVVIFSGDESEDSTWYADRSEGYVLKDAEVRHLVETLERITERTHRPGVASVVLPQDLASVGEARRFVRERLVSWDLEDLLDAAYLVVSELAANAITHAGSHYEVSLTSAGDAVRVAVRDFGPGLPAPGPRQLADEHGRGLLLVSAMAASWGVEPRTTGKVVWAELRSGDDEGAT